MNLKKLIFTKNDCYKAGLTIKPKGIMVHSTAANNPLLRRYVGPDDGYLGFNPNNNHWNVPGVKKCVHAFIGKLADGSIATYQTLPWNHRAWHCASGKKGSGNDTYISFEICEDGLTDRTYFNKVYKEAVELCVYLCKMYGLTEKTIICHSEAYDLGIASNHSDVMHWFPKHGKSMDTFRADVKKLLDGESESLEECDMKYYKEYEDVPACYQEAIKILMDNGALKGSGDADKDGKPDLNISEDLARTLTILHRIGVF